MYKIPIDWKCIFFGHKWEVVYIGKTGSWKFIGAFCGRWQCYKGHQELLDYLEKIDHDFGTFSEKYFDK